MAVDTLVEVNEVGTNDFLIVHLYCDECNPDVALCGTSLIGVPDAEDGGEGCVVCAAMNEGHECNPSA